MFPACACVKLREGRLAEGRGIAVEAGSDLLQSVFGGAVLALFHVGEAGEVQGVFAGFGHAVLAGDLREERVGLGGAVLGGVKDLHAGRQSLPGSHDRGLIDLHGIAERGLRCRRAVLVQGVRTHQDQDETNGEATEEKSRLAILFCPIDAVFGGEHELILLPGVALKCGVHWVGSVLGVGEGGVRRCGATHRFSLPAGGRLLPYVGPWLGPGVSPFDDQSSSCQPYKGRHSIRLAIEQCTCSAASAR